MPIDTPHKEPGTLGTVAKYKSKASKSSLRENNNATLFVPGNVDGEAAAKKAADNLQFLVPQSGETAKV